MVGEEPNHTTARKPGPIKQSILSDPCTFLYSLLCPGLTMVKISHNSQVTVMLTYTIYIHNTENPTACYYICIPHKGFPRLGTLTSTHVRIEDEYTGQ